MSDIYIVAVKSDEYDDEAILPDVLRTEISLPSFNSHNQSRTRAFLTLEAAQEYRQTFAGNLISDYSIFRVELAETAK